MFKTILAPLSIVMLAACAQHTPIAQVTLPAASIIEGKVTAVEDAESFTLEDASGTIEVEWEGDDIKPALSVGEKVIVAGVLDEDESIGEASVMAEEFDAYCLKRADGTLIQALPVCPIR